ncbi:MAG: CopD family protein [Gammaproteobacteria bacterium]
MSVSIALHLLAAVIWVGGMFFAYMALRPAAASTLEPPQRLQLWVQVFKLFFIWVWLSIITLLVSGYWMLFAYFGGFANAGVHIHVMHGAGIVMVLIYLHVFFAPYRRLRHAVIMQDYPEGGKRLAQIRKMIALNLGIGLCVVLIASGGRYL